MWRPLRRVLGNRATIAFDAPGTGRSETPRGPLRMRRLAGVVAALLDALGEREVDVLGYSFGGALGQQLAHDRPRRVRRLILAGTTAGVVSIPAMPHVFARVATPGRVSRGVAVTPSLLGFGWQLAAMTGWTSAHWLHRISQPTLVLAGDDDPLVPLVNARFLAHQIPRGQLHVVRGGGHLFLIDQPHDVINVVDDFLAKEQP
jgi:pimeloyl-ACP methyl ester carboxylesterase